MPNLVETLQIKSYSCQLQAISCKKMVSYPSQQVLRALVVELVDTRDLKSLGVRAVPVQVRPGAPSNMRH